MGSLRILYEISRVVMDSKVIVVRLAEKEMAFRLHFAGTEMPFLYYGGKIADRNYDRYIQVDKDKVTDFVEKNNSSESYAEYINLLLETGDCLLHEECMLFHGVGMIYKEKGYILTAPSGTGKSTQFRNLHMIYGDNCRIINGDKPIVRRISEKEHRIYPSLWNGKEKWAGTENAPIQAIIWLRQGSENLIERPQISEMVLPLLSQVIYTAPDSHTVHKACQMLDSLLSYIPVYQFTNTGTMESSEMLGKFLDQEAAD